METKLAEQKVKQKRNSRLTGWMLCQGSRFSAASKRTIPICIDDVSEKSADSWEELIIDAYNGTGRGTRLYGVEVFHTLPILSANWRPQCHFTGCGERS